MTHFLGNFRREVLTPNPLSAPHPLRRWYWVALTVSCTLTDSLRHEWLTAWGGGQLESCVLPSLLWSPASSLGPQQVHAPHPASLASMHAFSAAPSKALVFLGGSAMIVRQYRIRRALWPLKTFLFSDLLKRTCLGISSSASSNPKITNAFDWNHK